ncbi:unnamed protein product [Closterium sp. Naga37s-1]|nr:unnamed protein product [Closterium sp. Naga37s-1]
MALHASPRFLRILATLASLAALVGAQPQQRGIVDLKTIPENSVSSWSLQGPPALRKESSPGQFKLVGPVVLNVLKVIRPQFTPIQAEWLSSNLTSDPATWTASIAPPSGANEFANLTFQDPIVQIWGGRFDIDNTTSDYSFKPNNTRLVFSRVSGTLLLSNVDKQNVVITLPAGNIPTLNGKFIRRGPVFELISGGELDIPLRVMVDALGVEPGPPPPGPNFPDEVIMRFNLSLQAIGRQPPRTIGGRPAPAGPGREPPPLAGVPSAAPAPGPAPVPAPALAKAG